MTKKKIEFQIKSSIFDDLIHIQKKLPNRATNGNDTETGGAASAYDQPAGMALLGMKDGEVDTVVELKMSGGCWDAPNINYNDMDVGFRALIAKDRICSGMALVRHPTWRTGHDSLEGTMPSHLKAQLHGMRNSFEDITKTAWIVLHNSYFRVYRPTKASDGKIGVKEIPIDGLFVKDEKLKGLLAEKVKRDQEIMKANVAIALAKRKASTEARKLRIRAQKEEEARREAIRKAELTKIEAAHQVAELKKKRAREKQELINSKLRNGVDDIIDAGNGCVFMRQKDGTYILWSVKP